MPYHTKRGKTEYVFSEVRNKIRVSTLPALLQYSFGIPSQSSNKVEIKGIQIEKEEVKLCLFGDKMMWSYI
jgi:hypothetical protein